MNSFKIALAQFSPHIGNLEANAEKMLEQANEAKKQNADIIVFPELSTVGYPAEDLLLRPSLGKRTKLAFDKLAEIKDIVLVFGFVNQTEDGQRYNSAAVMKDGQVLGIYNKQNLPNYSVFDEKRYFSEGHQHLVFEYLGHKFGVGKRNRRNSAHSTSVQTGIAFANSLVIFSFRQDFIINAIGNCKYRKLDARKKFLDNHLLTGSTKFSVEH